LIARNARRAVNPIPVETSGLRRRGGSGGVCMWGSFVDVAGFRKNPLGRAPAYVTDDDRLRQKPFD
jgi:hypothetical protein